MNREQRKKNLPSRSLLKTFNNIDRSRKDAIKIFCIECVGNGPGYRKTIKFCTDTGCPLYAWRPYLPKLKDKIKVKKCCDNQILVKTKKGNLRCKSCNFKFLKKKKKKKEEAV